MLCKKCGAQNSDHARFCTRCGERQDLGGALSIAKCPICRKPHTAQELQASNGKCPKFSRKIKQECAECGTPRILQNGSMAKYCHVCGSGEFQAVGRKRKVLKVCPICKNPKSGDRCDDSGCASSLVINAVVDGDKLGKFTITQYLGRGGMGMVYKAVASDGTEVALKEIRPIITPAAIDPDALYRNELQAMAILKRIPEFVKLRGTFTNAQGRYVIMELLPGETLEGLVTKRGKLPKRFVWQTMQKLCSVVYRANRAAVLRDLKSSNVMITNPNDPSSLRIFDLGYVYMTNMSAFRFSQNIVLGSPGFSPKEQLGNDVLYDLERAAQGSRPGFSIPGSKPRVEWPPSPKWDVHAIGAIAYHLLTGDDPALVLYNWDFNKIDYSHNDPFRRLLETALSDNNRFNDVHAMLAEMQHLGGY